MSGRDPLCIFAKQLIISSKRVSHSDGSVRGEVRNFHSGEVKFSPQLSPLRRTRKVGEPGAKSAEAETRDLSISRDVLEYASRITNGLIKFPNLAGPVALIVFTFSHHTSKQTVWISHTRCKRSLSLLWASKSSIGYRSSITLTF